MTVDERLAGVRHWSTAAIATAISAAQEIGFISVDHTPSVHNVTDFQLFLIEFKTLQPVK